MNISSLCRRLTSTSITSWLVVALGLGCGGPTDPRDALSVDLTVTPSVVSPGDSFVVTLTIVNLKPFPIQLGSGDSCVALPEVRVAGERQPWEGTALGCLAVVSTFTVPAFGVLTWEFSLVALLEESTAPWDYTVPPPPGTYTLVMEMHVELPDVENEFIVTE